MVEDSKHDVTLLLDAIAQGDEMAQSDLFSKIYAELRSLANGVFAGRAAGHTLQPTAIVHEVYLRLVKVQDPSYENKKHFIGLAAKAMRQVVLNHARDKRAAKRGGDRVQLTLHEDGLASPESEYDMMELEDALAQLERIDPGQARIVELRFFGGLTFGEIASLVDSSETTVRREWRMARAELMLMLRDGQD